MSRIIFPKGEQTTFINNLLEGKRLKIDNLANICRVSSRTIRDWRREKFTLSEKALLQLSNKLDIIIPSNIKHVPNYWYIEKGARKGALKRLAIYGPPGTAEGRARGGRMSQLRRKENPEKYRLLGCNVRKSFLALVFSTSLAEATGIILGDGGITNYQLKIFLDRKTDRDYGKYVQHLFHKVFGEYPSFYDNKKDGTLELVISGANLVDNLGRIGLEKGDKIKRQVDFPRWIWKKREYQVACVRGLIDTDGGLYFHKHWSRGIRYRNLGLCFTSWSKPLLISVYKVLEKYKIKFSVDNDQRIYIYSLKEIEKYFSIFGTSNSKISQQLDYHKSNSKVLEKNH